MMIFITILVGFVMGQDESLIKNAATTFDITRTGLIEHRGNFRPLLDQMAEFYLFESDEDLSKEGLKQAQLVKYYLMHGELSKAKNYITSLYLSDTKNRVIIDRYLALIYFLDQEYKKSYELLIQKDLQVFPRFSRICFMQTILEGILEKPALQTTWNRCKLENQETSMSIFDSWLELIIQVKISKSPSEIKRKIKALNIKTINNEQLKFVLKMSLLMQIDQYLMSEFDYFDYSIFVDPELREIMSFIYFRNGQFENALKIAEGLQTANIENMKGVLYLKLNKYELAFSQFQLALKIKSNSFNAIRRSLPLSVLLHLPEAGIKLIRLHSKQNETNKISLATLEAYFLTELNKYKDAQEILNKIYQKREKSAEQEIHTLLSVTSFHLNDLRTFKRHAVKACDANDFLACWTLLENTNWSQELPMALKRTDPIYISQSKNDNFIQGETFKDNIYVNQKDIDELDNALIQLNY